MKHQFLTQIDAALQDPEVAGLQYTTHYTSAAASTVTPPAGILQSPTDSTDGVFMMPDGESAVTLDSWGSQASRMEAAAEATAENIGFPLIRFFDAEGELLTTNLRLSHRHADATWRLAQAELRQAGVPFDGIRDATIEAPDTLLTWFPTAILFGWWHSHVAKDKNDAAVSKAYGEDIAEALAGYSKIASAARSARLITSEIIASGIARRSRRAARQDSLFGPRKGVAGTNAKAPKPSSLGIGSMPPVRSSDAPMDVTYRDITGQWFFSLTGLRQFSWKTTDSASARRLVVTLALLLREESRRDSRLRAGTELVETSPRAQGRILRHGHAPEELAVPELEELRGIVSELGKEAGWQGATDVTIPRDAPLDRMLRRTEKAPEEEA